jgi:hypothetical protein
MTDPQRWYGKFRGVVTDNLDPERRGRLRAVVPDVLGSTPSSWAMPCVPLAGPGMGVWVMPPVGAGVWVEFEQGDPDYPIWVGGWWGSAVEVPGGATTVADPSSVVVLQTARGTVIEISDIAAPTGGVSLRTPSGAVVEVSDLGITIANGRGASIVLSGPTIVFNNGAMTVP